MIKEIVFILISALYIILLAVVDGLFNRLIFRENRKLSYFSKIKQEIFKRWEWTVIGILFLIVLPVIIPVTISFFIGGIKYVLLYLLILFIVPWDVIFGRLVFDDYFGDTPSIALPFVGWLNIPLKIVYTVRLILVLILVCLIYVI